MEYLIMSLILPPVEDKEILIFRKKFLYYKLNNINNSNTVNNQQMYDQILIIHNTEDDTITPIYDFKNSIEPDSYNFDSINEKLKSKLYNTATINNTITINTEDKDVNISITSRATFFNIRLIIDDNFISIYKKIYHNKLDPITSVSTNYSKHKARAIESICKIAEFVYENKKFINNLIKIKKIIMINNFKSSNVLTDSNKIAINVEELSKLKHFKQLSEQESLNPTNIYNIKIKSPNPNLNISRFFISRLTDLIYPTKNNLKTPIETIINKQNFNMIDKIKVETNLMFEKYITNIPDGFLISRNYYNKLYNNNKKLNYYYGKKFTNSKFTIFDNNPTPDIYGKIKYYDESYHKITNHKIKFLMFVKSYSNNIRILSKRNILSNFNQEEQLIELETNYNHIKKLEDEFNQLMTKFDKGISFILLIQYLFNRNKFQINEEMVSYSKSNHVIFIHNKITSKLSKAIENIKYNIEVNKLENFKIIKSINDSIIDNDLLFVMFNQNIIMKQGNIFPARFTKILKNLISHNYYDRSRFLTEIVNPKKTTVEAPNIFKVFDTSYDYRLHDLLILMSNKFSKEEVEDIKNRWVLITLNYL